MKIRNCMALICAVVALSACGRTVIMREENSSEGTSSAVIEPVAVGKKTAKEKIDLSGLSHDKVGYGQGVLVDEKNRTTGALDFNAQYGKLNAKAINNDDKIYLTFDQGYENGYTEKILDVRYTIILCRRLDRRNVSRRYRISISIWRITMIIP